MMREPESELSNLIDRSVKALFRECPRDFTAIRLWEHADRIRSGELIELAPLLLLGEESPTEQSVRESDHFV